MPQFEARASGEKDQHGKQCLIIVNTATGKRLPKRRFTDESLAVQEAAYLSQTVKGVYNFQKKTAKD